LIVKYAIQLLAALATGLASPVHAASAWTIIPGESRVTLTGELEGQPTEVDLTSLTGDIVFDPADLPASRLKIVIDLGKISAGYDAIVETLTSAAWFNVPKFPSGVFTSQAITKRPDGRYSAAGTLALKGTTKPVTVVFAVENRGTVPGKPDVERAVAKGETVIDRTAFTIGEDAWGKSVANGVRVTFTVVADRPTSR
jgi:polyisoprenoid-binding protein YceI